MKKSIQLITLPIAILLLVIASLSFGARSASAAPALGIDTLTHRVFSFTSTRVSRTGYDTIRIWNGGTGSLTVDSVRIFGTTSGAYSVVRVPDTAIAANQFEYIALAFSPTSTGLYHDSVVVYTNGGVAGEAMNGIGVIPGISLGTTTVNFDSVRVGDQTCQPIMITNTGTDTLAITSNYQATVNSNYLYQGLTGRDTLIAPGASRPIGICFLPTTTGLTSTTIAVKPDIPGDTTTRYITVSGYGVRVSGLTPSTLNLTSAIIRQTTCTTDTLLSMGGENNVIISSVRVVGADSSAVTLTRPTMPDTVRPDSSFIYSLCVNPTHRGPLQASVVVNYSTLGILQTAQIPLNINGLQVCSSVAPTTLFNTPTLLGTSDTARFTVTNCGDVPSSYTIASPLNAAFRVLGNVTSPTVAPGASTTFTVVYTPTALGNAPDTVTITGGTGVTPMNITLAGTPGVLQIAGTDTVPDVAVGNCQDFVVRLQNTGNMTWTSGLPLVIGTNSSDFTVKSASSLTLAPNTSQNVTITFCPHSTATETAILTFPGASPNVNTRITLSGQGVRNGVEDNAATLALSSVYPNPAKSTATFAYSLATPADVRIELVDARGALLQLVTNDREAEGAHSATIDTKSLAEGTYFLLLTTGDKQVMKQLTVIH